MEAVGFCSWLADASSSGWQTGLAWSASFETASVRPQNTKEPNTTAALRALHILRSCLSRAQQLGNPLPTIATSTVAARGRHVWKTASD